MRALELAEGGPSDSDIAAPIIDASGVVRGVVAARGVPGGGSSMAALRDLVGDRRLGVARDLRAVAPARTSDEVDATKTNGPTTRERNRVADVSRAPMPERSRHRNGTAVAPWIAASIADLVGLGLIVGVQEPWTLAAAAGCHLAALLPIAFLRRLSPSEKALALSFVFALPVVRRAAGRARAGARRRRGN